MSETPCTATSPSRRRSGAGSAAPRTDAKAFAVALDRADAADAVHVTLDVVAAERARPHEAPARGSPRRPAQGDRASSARASRATASNVICPSTISVAVRSTPSTDTESPSAVTPRRRRRLDDEAHARRRRRPPPTTVPRSRTMPVNTALKARHSAELGTWRSNHPQPPPSQGARFGVGQAMPHERRAGLCQLRAGTSDRRVRARRAAYGSWTYASSSTSSPTCSRPEPLQSQRRREPGNERRPVAGELRRDEHEELVDQVRGEERRRQRRASLEQQRLHAFAARARAARRRAAPLRSSSSEPSGSGPRPNASRRGCFGASTSRASSRGASARTVPIPTATASTQPRSSWTRRRDSSPLTQRSPGNVIRPSSVTAAL